MHKFWISDCPYLEVILKNDVLASKGSLQGIYALKQIINGKTSWKSASKAIWYDDVEQNWHIGNLENIGTSTREIFSNGDQSGKSPSDVPLNNWYHQLYGRKEGDGDIIVQCKKNNGKICT